jgi:hypothetical protein
MGERRRGGGGFFFGCRGFRLSTLCARSMVMPKGGGAINGITWCEVEDEDEERAERAGRDASAKSRHGSGARRFFDSQRERNETPISPHRTQNHEKRNEREKKFGRKGPQKPQPRHTSIAFSVVVVAARVCGSEISQRLVRDRETDMKRMFSNG